DGAAALQGEDRYVLRLLQEEWPSRVKLECFIALLQPDWRERRDSAYRRRRQLQQQQQQPQQAPESAATQATVPLLVEVAAADGDLNARDAAASLSQPMAGISAALAGATPPAEFLAFKHFYSLDGALFEYVCGMRVSELQLDRDELMNADADPVADAAAIVTEAKQFALVAWPAERSFDLARGCGLSALVSLTLHFGRRCDPGLQVMMRCLLDAFASETDWPRLRRSLKVPADAELLRVLGQLDDASLANKFVGEVLAREMPASHGQMVCLGVRNVTTADRLYGLAARFGWPAMETSMLRLMRAVPSAHLTYLARWCPSLEAAVSACSSTALPQPLAVLLIRSLESATSGAVAARDGNNNAGRGDNPTVRFGLQCLLACEHEGLCRRLVDFVNMSVANSASFIAKTLRSFLAGRSRQRWPASALHPGGQPAAVSGEPLSPRRVPPDNVQEKWSYLSQRSFANENLIELVDFLHAVQSDELWQRFHRLIDSLGQQVSRSGTADEERQHLQLAYSNLLRDLAERVLLNGFQADSRACRKLLELRRRQLEAANSCR
uniref:FH2 domain-containing protein n=1 Tax=Macrostomum lignano TaxID=282301 RepID=A0A1I8HXL1_9PLAT